MLVAALILSNLARKKSQRTRDLKLQKRGNCSSLQMLNDDARSRHLSDDEPGKHLSDVSCVQIISLLCVSSLMRAQWKSKIRSLDFLITARLHGALPVSHRQWRGEAVGASAAERDPGRVQQRPCRPYRPSLCYSVSTALRMGTHDRSGR